MAKEWYPDSNRMVLVSAPEKAGVAVPDESRARRPPEYRRRAEGRDRDEPHRLRRHRRRHGPARDAAGAGAGREDDDEGGDRDHRMGAGQRRQGRAEAHDLPAGRDPLPRRQPGRDVARERRRLHPGQHRDAGGHRRRPRQIQQRRSAQGADREDRLGDAVHRRARRGTAGQRVAEGSRDDVPVDPHAVHAAARRPRGLRRADQPVEDADGEPGQHARLRVLRRAHGDHGAEPSAPAAADAGDDRRVEPREVDGVLQGPLRRRERLHVRLRRQHRSRRDEAAGRALPREPAVDPPQGDVEGRRGAHADGRHHQTRGEGHRAEEPVGDRSSPDRSTTRRTSASRSAR